MPLDFFDLLTITGPSLLRRAPHARTQLIPAWLVYSSIWNGSLRSSPPTVECRQAARWQHCVLPMTHGVSSMIAVRGSAAALQSSEKELRQQSSYVTKLC